MRRNITDFEYEKFKRYRRFMQQIPDSDSRVPKCCADCECFQPNWKYRTCLYPRCKYGKNINPFRERPLSHDVIPNYYQAMLDLRDLMHDCFDV